MAVFWLVLHRRALVLAPLLLLVNRDYFTADFDLINRLRVLKSARQVYDEIDDFQLHPGDRGVLHRRLKVRVSIERVIRLVYHVFGEAQRATMVVTHASQEAEDDRAGR